MRNAARNRERKQDRFVPKSGCRGGQPRHHYSTSIRRLSIVDVFGMMICSNRLRCDHEQVGAYVIRTWTEIVAAVGVSGLVIYAWWRLRRRSWSASRRDEAMRRHINHYY